MKKLPVLLLFVISIISVSFSSIKPVAASESRVNNLAAFSQLNLYPNIETIGVVVSGISLPKKAGLMYRQSGETNWRTGHPLMRIDDGRLVGSLFGLSPSTSYEIKVLDGGATEISGSITTQPNELQFTPANILHVNDDAPAGGDGSAAAPFKTIQEGINRASPGTQVLVSDGIYREAVKFPASGTANNWIQVKAEGSGAILDGSENLSGNIWTPYEGKGRVWSIKLGRAVGYLARDEKRFYMFESLSKLFSTTGHNNVPITEGWYLDPGTFTLYVRSLDDPSNHTWQVPFTSHAFDANGRDWLWIEGFEVRFYNRCGVCTLNTSHLVIRRNRIHNMQLGIFIDWTGSDGQGNDTRIEYNEVYDPLVDEWPWKAVKGSSMEGTAVIIRGHIGAIVRGNEIHNFFNGIYSGSSGALENSALAFDADIYNNHIHHISDDAFEPEGACINQRFRNNTVDKVLVGVSLAPITQGPVWVLRSSISNFNGMAVKWDRNSNGVVLIYHNTSWSNVKDANAIEMISPAHNAVMRNNIFSSTGYSINEASTGSTGNDWNYDNWYTTNAIHFKWENVPYDSVAKLCAASGLECNGYEAAPGLTNPAGGDFTLLASSPNIDKGAVIPGINDQFSGGAPDVGAFERVVDSPPTVLSIVRADANPTGAANVNFTVTFSEPVTGVGTADFGIFTDPAIVGATVTSVTSASTTTYTIGVNTGFGNGIIRLDLVDNDSIMDASSNPLGGTGAGNGNFNTGDFYTIEKNAPMVSGILTVDPNPTGTDSVRFTVNFSKEVSGVDAGDFGLFTTGNITGATVANVSGSANIYTVTVNTGVGDGTLRLDVIDNDSIVDTTANPLGGTGAGNGNFNTGSVYAIDKTAPITINILRADPNPTATESVRFIVNFSEAVNGVDAGDFVLTTTDSLTGASILGLSGSANSYTVIVADGNGVGNLRLDLVDNDSIIDALGHPLGGVGIGNGNFNTGEMYSVNRPPVSILSETFRSNGANDGWVLESNEDSNKGGPKNSNATTFNLGDDAKDRMYRAILHFPTSYLPDNAVITQAILMIKRQGNVGTDPFNTHQGISIDIRKGAFGSIGPFSVAALQALDFQAPADKYSVGVIQNNPVSGWYWSVLDNSALPFINLIGVTQFRLGFQLDDNDDRDNDYLKFFSGNSNALEDRPQLVIKYFVP
ncbi:MAG: hypothetical protein HY863_03900 [Chloroflexi bacterium]|nr:hypothetical protein [Chloroflexota bacterium]